MSIEKTATIAKNTKRFVVAFANFILLLDGFLKEHKDEIKEIGDILVNSAKAITMK